MQSVLWQFLPRDMTSFFKRLLVVSLDNYKYMGCVFNHGLVPYFGGDLSFFSLLSFKKGCCQLQQVKVCVGSTHSQACPGKCGQDN